jgi:hypothetical protein
MPGPDPLLVEGEMNHDPTDLLSIDFKPNSPLESGQLERGINAVLDMASKNPDNVNRLFAMPSEGQMNHGPIEHQSTLDDTEATADPQQLLSADEISKLQALTNVEKEEYESKMNKLWSVLKETSSSSPEYANARQEVQNMSSALISEEQTYRQMNDEEQLKEHMRKRPTSFGFEEDQVEAMLLRNSEDDATAQHDTTPAKAEPLHKHQLTYPKIHKQHLAIETLLYYDIPYEYDKSNSDYIVILRVMDTKETDILFEHTRRLREGALFSSQTNVPAEKQDRAVVPRTSQHRGRSSTIDFVDTSPALHQGNVFKMLLGSLNKEMDATDDSAKGFSSTNEAPTSQPSLNMNNNRDKLADRPNGTWANSKDGTIDIDKMISEHPELRAKARYSESGGLVVDHKDVEAALKKLNKDYYETI